MESCRDNDYEQHSGFQIVKRSTLAYVNEHRNYEVYEDVYYALYRLNAPGICQDTSKKLVRSLFIPEEPQQGLCPYASLPQDIFLT